MRTCRRRLAGKSVLFQIGVVLLLTVGFAGVGVTSAVATTLRESRPCGDVTFEYSAARVHPGDAMDMELIVDNCSRHPERLRVHARSHGPCRFPHPVDHTYSLSALSGVGSFALVLAPSCPGQYSVDVKLILVSQDRTLDIAGDGFVVRWT